jgi:hypothetical protein
MAPRFEWTLKKDKLLLNKYFNMTVQELATILGTNSKAVLRRARLLQIPKKTDIPELNKQYTETEIAFIVTKVNKIGVTEVATTLNRSEEAIRVFCKRRNIRITVHNLWTRKQIKYLNQNALKLSIEELAKDLGKSPQAIRKYANELNIPLRKATEPKPLRRWTPAEREYLENNLHLTHYEIGKSLGRTAEAVARYASSNGIYKAA